MIIIKRKQGVVFSFRLFISFFLPVLGPGCRTASPPAAPSRASVVHRPLAAAASPAAEHVDVSSCGSRALEH